MAIKTYTKPFFDAEYTYDDLGNPRTLKRWGVIDYTSGGEATYGLLDDLTFSYPVQSSQLESVASAAEGTDFYGRVGFPLAGSQYTWNDAGLMTSDSAFGITAITYNDFGLPTRMSTQNRNNYTTYAYTADGLLLERKKFSPGSSPFRANSTGSVYSAGRIFTTSTENINLNSYISYFPGGYFDGNGGVHYIHLDYQGSVVMETDSTGHIETHRGYYPYGEPWAESSKKKTLKTTIAQPQTYQSKERTTATGDYDFGPRRYISAAPFWRAPDPKAHDYPNISPYAFCAANPIRYSDPTGMDVWVMNNYGKIKARMETDLMDYIMILNENIDLSGDTKPLKYGTVKQVRDGTTFKISDNDVAQDLFETMGEAITRETEVECSILTGREGKKDAAYVSTSGEVGKENSMKDVLNSINFKKTKVFEFIHTHPYTIDMSGDKGAFNSIKQQLEKKNFSVPKMGIFYTGNKSENKSKQHPEYNEFLFKYIYWN